VRPSCDFWRLRHRADWLPRRGETLLQASHGDPDNGLNNALYCKSVTRGELSPSGRFAHERRTRGRALGARACRGRHRGRRRWCTVLQLTCGEGLRRTEPVLQTPPSRVASRGRPRAGCPITASSRIPTREGHRDPRFRGPGPRALRHGVLLRGDVAVEPRVGQKDGKRKPVDRHY